ncbi:unnamed protein product [Euphydryas editha]|uniref:Uncharacterized protein n=1 Tax=Euphydryas editha TaxID=104508 RepID=A0AAU9TPJ5_EUPED|nr:unnamed protein product [Euphydryas editha]
MHRPGNNFIPVIEFTSSVDDTLESPELFGPRDQDNSSLLESEDNETDSTFTAALQASRSTTPLVRISTPADQAQANETDASVVQHTNFYNWLINTVILDDLSYRQPFINSAQDANQLTQEDLFLHALDLYHNADQLSPQELVNLPFLPRTMRTGDTLLDIPFFDPLLVVLRRIHIDDVHWMLNVLPWRVVDRPIRTGRSILASNNDIPVTDIASSSHDFFGSLQLPERRQSISVVEFLFHLDETRPEGSEPGHQDYSSSLESEDDELDSTFTTVLQTSGSTAPPVRFSTFANHVQATLVQGPEVQPNNFHNWLINTVILDDLSYREPFINSARDANQLTYQDLFSRALSLYKNADLMGPQELVDLPFLPCAMRTRDILLDIPFLNPLLIVFWCLHMEDVQWMLNVLPWRVVDRPIRTGCSILAWIIGMPSFHEFMEETRAPLSIVIKLIRFVDMYHESL